MKYLARIIYAICFYLAIIMYSVLKTLWEIKLIYPNRWTIGVFCYNLDDDGCYDLIDSNLDFFEYVQKGYK